MGWQCVYTIRLSRRPLPPANIATFSIAANTGYKVSLTNLSRLDYRRSSSGPPNGALQYQVGSGAFVDITALSYSSTASSGASLGPINLAGIPALQNVGAGTNVTFRIVNWGASSSGGNWYIYNVASSTADDLEVQGTIAAACSSPTALTPTASPGFDRMRGHCRNAYRQCDRRLDPIYVSVEDKRHCHFRRDWQHLLHRFRHGRECS